MIEHAARSAHRSRGWRTVATALLALLSVTIVVVCSVFLNGSLVMERALRGQATRLSGLQAEVADLPGGRYQDWRETSIPDDTPLTAVQMIATHNSYAAPPNTLQNLILKIAEPGTAETLAYRHPAPWEQLDLGIRSMEFDLRTHSDGHLRLTHVPLVANDSNAPGLLAALAEIALWSSSHPGHLPITVLIEFKSDHAELDPTLSDWNPQTLRAADAKIREVLGPALLTPADLDAETWPAVGSLRGRVMIIMHPN